MVKKRVVVSIKDDVVDLFCDKQSFLNGQKISIHKRSEPSLILHQSPDSGGDRIEDGHCVIKGAFNEN